MNTELAIVLCVIAVFGLIGWLGSEDEEARKRLGKDWTGRQ